MLDPRRNWRVVPFFIGATKRDVVILLVLGKVTLEIMRFDRAAACSVFGIEVEHDPLSLEIMKADLAPILGWQCEIRGGLTSLRYGVGGK